MSTHISAAQKAAVAAAAAFVQQRSARRFAEAAAAQEAAVYLDGHLLIEDPLFDDGYNAPAPVYEVDLKLMKREEL